MPAACEFVLDFPQLGPHPFLDGHTAHPEQSSPARRTHVREAEEVERFRAPQTPPGSIAGGTPPEFDQPSLVRV
jgi:hypothetical protein